MQQLQRSLEMMIYPKIAIPNILIISISKHHHKYIQLMMKQRSEEERAAIERLKIMLKVGQSFKKWHKQQRNSKQRYHILKQWQSTEKSYIQDLKIIEKDIQRPLKLAKLINDEQERLLFPNIKAMIQLSQSLLKCIQKTIQTWNPIKTMIGQDLMVFYKFFMIYREYCNNFMKAQEIVKTLKKIPEAAKIQEKLKLDFESYTIKPVQRPPKYQLLLRQYHKSLSKTHKDYKIIESAIQKYHEVNELNNQSMDRQIRAQIMIKLDKKFGNVISSRTGREYLKQFTCKSFTNKCIIYAFNDMLLIIHKKSEDNEVIYKRIYLDGTSYITYKQHFKYYSNQVFICGVSKSIHLEFDTFADTEHFYEEISAIITRLYKKELQRAVRLNQNQTRRKNLAKFRVTKWFEELNNKIVYKPKLEIKIDSTLKSKDQAFYAVQFKVVHPYSHSQTILVSFGKVIEVLQYLKSKYKDFQYTKLSTIPQHIGIIQLAKNRAKIIQFRTFAIEEFLNLIFRDDHFYYSWKTISDQLGINPSVFQFASKENFTCECFQCIQVKQSQPVSYYMGLLKRLKQSKRKMVASTFSAQEIKARNRIQMQQIVSNIFREKQDNCTSYIFNLLQSIKDAEKESFSNFGDRMLALQAEAGHINFSLFPYHAVPLRSQVKMKIFLLSIEKQYIQITLKQDKYVRQILQDIAEDNSLATIFDWSLYIYNDGNFTKIGNDQKLLEYISKWGVDIQKTEEKIEESFFGDKIGHIKRWGQQLFGSKKGKLFLKKYLHFQHEVQVDACKNNKERFTFLINEVFGRIKYENLCINQSELVSMCAFYMIKNQFQKVKYWTQDNIDLNPLKEIIPLDRQHLLKNTHFKAELFSDIRKSYEQLQQFQNSRNAIEIIYLKMLHFLRNNQDWITKYFPLTIHGSQEENDVMIGVNYNYFTVVKAKQRKNLLTIELRRLKYKTSTFAMFVFQGQTTYRYNGPQTSTIRQMIEIYLSYLKMFTN